MKFLTTTTMLSTLLLLVSVAAKDKCKTSEGSCSVNGFMKCGESFIPGMLLYTPFPMDFAD